MLKPTACTTTADFARPARRRAVHAIEALVTTAAAGLLLALFVPALGHARDRSRSATCTDLLRGFAVGFQVYANDNHDWYPGVNTSGVEVREKANIAGALNGPYLPVQSFDWMTPAVGVPLPANRAARFHALLSDYRCPHQGAEAELYFSTPCVDEADFRAIANWPAPSYLGPGHFAYWGSDYAGVLAGHHQASGAPLYLRTIPSSWEVRSNNFRSNAGFLTRPETRIAVADGTRYVEASGTVDFDVAPDPIWFGSFTDAGGWWAGATAYGVRAGSQNWHGAVLPRGSPSQGLNLTYTYRHDWPPGWPADLAPDGSAQCNLGALNAAYYDGHVACLNDELSRTITGWYPGGATVLTPEEGMTTVPAGYVIP